MLDYNTIQYKGNINKDLSGNYTNYIDLLSKSVNTDFNVYFMPRIVIVNEFYVARPDLISLAIYGTDKYADVICKFNGISNPFEINEDMTLYCPTVSDIERYFISTKTPSELIDSSSTIVEKKSTAVLKSAVRSPGQATVNDKNFTIDKTNNYVFY